MPHYPLIPASPSVIIESDSAPYYPPVTYAGLPSLTSGGRKKFWLVLLVIIAAAIGVILFKEPLRRFATSLAPAVSPAWCAGSWVAESGADTPRLEIDTKGQWLSGYLVLNFANGYNLSLPFNGQISDRGGLFAVNQPRSRAVAYYLLVPDGPDACRLYLLNTPPDGSPPDAALLPKSPEKYHRLVARLVRPATPTPLRLDVAAPKNPDNTQREASHCER